MKYCENCGCNVEGMSFCPECGSKCGPLPEQPRPDKEFSLRSGGAMFNSDALYYAAVYGDKVDLKIKFGNFLNNDEKTLETDLRFYKKIEDLVEKYDVKSWDGFNGHAEGVFDGTSFSFTLHEGGGTVVSAGGYMSWPKNYGAFSSEIAALFTELYELYNPNRTKIFQRFLDGIADEKYGGYIDRNKLFRFGYRRYSENSVAYQSCEIRGVLSVFICGFSDDPSDCSDMAVFYIDQEKSGRGYLLTSAGIDHYKMGEDLKPYFSSRSVVENNLLANDGMNGFFFTKRTDGGTLVGYSSYYSHNLVGDTFCCYSIFGISDGKLVCLASDRKKNERSMLFDPAELKESIEAAEKYGLTKSKESWEKGNGPMINTSDVNPIIYINLHSNVNNDGKLNEKMKELQDGDVIEGYEVNLMFCR